MLTYEPSKRISGNCRLLLTLDVLTPHWLLRRLAKRTLLHSYFADYKP